MDRDFQRSWFTKFECDNDKSEKARAVFAACAG
jgi:hypothetical protein